MMKMKTPLINALIIKLQKRLKKISKSFSIEYDCKKFNKEFCEEFDEEPFEEKFEVCFCEISYLEFFVDSEKTFDENISCFFSEVLDLKNFYYFKNILTEEHKKELIEISNWKKNKKQTEENKFIFSNLERLGKKLEKK